MSLIYFVFNSTEIPLVLQNKTASHESVDETEKCVLALTKTQYVKCLLSPIISYPIQWLSFSQPPKTWKLKLSNFSVRKIYTMKNDITGIPEQEKEKLKPLT